ncbi:ATP-binding protein [Nocardia caishijiensis]|uniref:Signal transduction histidine kinase n=1 Tax=Nocardia caishijiensis TaxID=184756 RepID=A0ABQ6YI16_9NOCA|nr:ATP-binding protein [Nocardia caishijiensis]KAF0845298.1 signal transduction histidine kinase [Nocardia caishijiensis]
MTPITAREGDNREQVMRRLALLIALSDALYAVMLSGRVAGDAAYSAVWWTPAAVLAVFVVPAAGLAWCARSGSVRSIELVASTVAVAFLVIVALWPVAWNGLALPGSMWLSFVPGLAAMTAALAWSPLSTVAYLLIATTAVQQINQHRATAINFAFGLELTYSLGFSLVFVAMILEGLRTAAALDHAREVTDRFGDDTAALEARAAQRRTHNTLIHNEVLSTLLAATSLPHSPHLQRRAAQAITRISTTPLVGDDRLYGNQHAVEILRAAVEDGGKVEMSLRCRDGQARAEAVIALADGAREAVRNARAHNPPGTRIRARIEADTRRVIVTIRDDGRGFDTTSTHSARYGLRGSLDRIRDIPGCAAGLDSAPGKGTTVTLRWRRPRPATPDIRQFLGIRTAAAAGVAVTYLAAISALALMSLHSRPGWASVTALVLFASMILVFLAAPADPIPRWATSAVILGPIGAVLALTELPKLPTAEQLWPASATAAIYALLLLRGRPAAAWTGQAIVVVGCTGWVGADLVGWGALMITRIADFAPLVGCMVFAWLVRPRLAAIVELRELNRQLVIRTTSARAALAERAAQLALFDARTAPLLSRIADPAEFSDAERGSFALLEACLRDELRGGILADPALRPILDDARRRGVDVLLYDDQQSTDHAPTTRAHILATLAAELTTAASGELTVRVQPTGRPIAATILVRGQGGTRRISIPANGTATFTGSAAVGGSRDPGARPWPTAAAKTS